MMRVLRQGNGDITQGVIWKQILSFFFPLWFGTFFQQLYNTVDTVVVGRFVGKAALAAVGSTGVVVSLTVGLFTGLASGAVVIIAQQYGARHGDLVHESVHTAMALSVAVGAGFMLAGFFLTPWALEALGTTADALPGAVLYLRLYFLGMIPNVIYNMGTGVLRAIGDSRRPLYFLMAASLCNIVLDLLLVLALDLGVAGVAVATVCSQALSAVLVVVSLIRSVGQPYQLFPRQLRFHPWHLKRILRIGVPAALQSVTYSGSNLFIQAAVNSFGTDTVAAWTAYGKMDVIYWMSINAMGLAITTFVGQNYGAGKIDRLKRGIWQSVGMSVIFTVLLSAAMILWARPILSIFTPDPAVLDIGTGMVRFLAPWYVTYILVELLAGAFRGTGRAIAPMLISIFCVCVLRLAWVFFAVPLHHTIPMVALSFPITWVTASTAFLIYYRWGRWLDLPGQAEQAQ